MVGGRRLGRGVEMDGRVRIGGMDFGRDGVADFEGGFSDARRAGDELGETGMKTGWPRGERGCLMENPNAG